MVHPGEYSERVSYTARSNGNFRLADQPTRNGPIWYERSTNMRRHEDWILVGVTAVFRQ
jgi:hypothetical protein